MRPQIHVLTLGVANLERSLDFYRALGLDSPGIIGTEFPGGTAAMFELADGLILALYGATTSSRTRTQRSMRRGAGSSASATSSDRARRSTRFSPKRSRQGQR
jgi:catechol 2,3-dioxygenase-like lactoylglutathione lyase family enzyme